MILKAYVGGTFEDTISLRVPAEVAHALESDPSSDWTAPAKIQLTDDNGAVWHADFLQNPQPQIVGAQYVYDYLVSFVVPELSSGNYQLSIIRHTTYCSVVLSVEGPARQAYGAENVLCLSTDQSVRWSLMDENTDATVTWRTSYRRVDGQDSTLSGGTTKTISGSDVIFTSENINPSVQGIQASIVPLPIIWDIQPMQDVAPHQTVSSLFVVNTDQLNFVLDLKSQFDRLCEERRLPELEYTLADYAQWARLGMDMFNAQGLFTTFIMTRATDGIRYWWFVCSLICALRAMYTFEGQRAFNFSGQSVSLEVDITQYLQTVMSDLQSQWDAEKLSFKQQLKMYGLIGGPGDMSAASLQIGALGLSLGPASNLGSFYFGRSYFNGLRFF